MPERIDRTRSDRSPSSMTRDALLTKCKAAEHPLLVLKETPGFSFPSHVALILDGNGRWAENHKVATTQGHAEGAKRTIQLIRALSQLPDIRNLSLWPLSPDNIEKRSPEEIAGIMYLAEHYIHQLTPEVDKLNGRIIHLGDPEGLSPSLQQVLHQAQEQTRNNTGKNVCLALNYGWQTEQRRIEKAIAEHVLKTNSSEFSDEERKRIYNPQGIENPSLVIRTGSNENQGNRLSGYPNSQFAQLVFSPVLLPDFSEHNLAQALIEYAFAEQRGGGRPKRRRG